MDKGQRAPWLLLGVAVLLIPNIAHAQVATVGEGCVTSKCHAGMGSGAYVHGPVGAQICSVCHTETDQFHKNGEVDLAVAAEELCYLCHEAKATEFNLPVQHQPVAQGECVGCHDPHQSEYRYQLRAEGQALCYEFHTNKTAGHEFVHGPAATGNCQLCHDPHATAFPRLLAAGGRDHCLECHQEKVRDMSKRHVHPPVEEVCTDCHNPHASDLQFNLHDSPPQLCYTCHPGIQDNVNASADHPPAEKGDCLVCHDVHSSDQPGILVQPGTDLCFSCHEQQGAEVLTDANRHGPVEQGDCSPCHNPHGQEFPYLLRQYFPEEFYMPYHSDNFALCFECHNRDIALEEKTKTLTDFRDGERNLHFVHVNKDVKGRSCKACHGVHSSNQAKHIRTEVPFGKSWSYPISFTKTENGGSCVVGCHKPQEYKR